MREFIFTIIMFGQRHFLALVGKWSLYIFFFPHFFLKIKTIVYNNCNIETSSNNFFFFALFITLTPNLKKKSKAGLFYTFIKKYITCNSEKLGNIFLIDIFTYCLMTIHRLTIWLLVNRCSDLSLPRKSGSCQTIHTYLVRSKHFLDVITSWF